VGPADAILVRLRELTPDDARWGTVRTQAIECYLPMAAFFARRYDGRGQPLADLTQIAVIGLIKAVDRYDPYRGVAFSSYAVPTILGEIRRHFRDDAWNVRVPRRLQELTLRLTSAVEDLTHASHRSPTTAELASRLGVSRDEVLAARLSAYAYRPVSLEWRGPAGDEPDLIDMLGAADPEIDAVDRRMTLRVVLAGLPERERRIIALRYGSEMTQAQIAVDVGLSQMQISRLLTRALAQLRTEMLV
jgi:RNA polymerase sigma-B factor